MELAKKGPGQCFFNPNLGSSVACHVEGGDSSIHVAGVRLSFLSPHLYLPLGPDNGGRESGGNCANDDASLPTLPSPLVISPPLL